MLSSFESLIIEGGLLSLPPQMMKLALMNMQLILVVQPIFNIKLPNLGKLNFKALNRGLKYLQLTREKNPKQRMMWISFRSSDGTTAIKDKL